MEEIIRMAKTTDATAIQAIYAPYVNGTAISFESSPPTVNDMADRIRKTLMHYPWLVFERNGEVIGYAYASSYRPREAYRWSVEVSAYVAQEYLRQGIGKKLYEKMLLHLEASGFANAFGVIALPNNASVALHESFGFQAVGLFKKVGYKLGKWHDVGWWQKTFQHPEKPIAPGGL